MKTPNKINRKNDNEENIVIITGLSGGGKTHASGVLQDLGYFVIDNTPPQIIPSLAQIVKSPNEYNKKLAIVADIRSGKYFNQLGEILDSLSNSGMHTTILFLDAKTDTLIKRYESSRRPHPLQGNNSLLDGIKQERDILYTLKLKADYVIDTSNLSIHDLSREINEIFNKKNPKHMKIKITSFGFKYGVPIDANFVIDVRFLPNPYWQKDLANKTGNQKEVYDYVFKQPGANEFVKKFAKLILSVTDKFIHENKRYLSIAVGCTGGKHRSVAVANSLKTLLTKKDIDITISARDINKKTEA
ncbi:MAG: RNase adapter RapZ [Bifidobacteriaceae bacterium]|jgi:UPF0042 nucleotide-binding protein|nr:RNase adapter RapZ [Bifidobacteriaceae bacterium]